jgi:hypothetical protein
MFGVSANYTDYASSAYDFTFITNFTDGRFYFHFLPLYLLFDPEGDPSPS